MLIKKFNKKDEAEDYDNVLGRKCIYKRQN